MKIVTLRVDGVEEVAMVSPVGGIAWLASAPAPGVLRRVSLTAEGVLVQRGTDAGVPMQVRIPLSEILRVAEAAEPGLAAGIPAVDVPGAPAEVAGAEKEES